MESNLRMPVKEWVRNLQPVQLYVVLSISIAFFVVELVVSHLTHALTLLMDSYHMLCNIFALAGCIFTIKYGTRAGCDGTDDRSSSDTASSVGEELTSATRNKRALPKDARSLTAKAQEKKLKNTFGWARIDVITMLMCCVFLASLCFSLAVEALQTLVHIDHLDEMHHPIPVLCLGGAGLLLNGVCFLLIGGYTFHQGSFLHVTESGDVVLDKVVVSSSVSKGEKRLSRSRNIAPSSSPRQRQGIWEMCRDSLGCIFVIICAIMVYWLDKDVAKYIDPIISLFSAATLMFFSWPYMTESCKILLQTMPDSMDIESLRIDLLKQFPGIVNVHDFHIWQLTVNKIVATVHIIFQNDTVYSSTVKSIKEFFIENGINEVTIQPEFDNNTRPEKFKYCMVRCRGEECRLNYCCQENGTESKIFKPSSKESIPGDSELSLISVRINSEFSQNSDVTLKENNTETVIIVKDKKENETIVEEASAIKCDDC